MSNIRMLARQLGLSITTVSRALDNYADVAPATRERVRTAARDMNYRPNAAARSLRRQRSNAVAVALPAGSGHAGLSGLFSMLLDASAELGREGLDLLMLPTTSAEDELASLKRLIDARRADAMILVRTRQNDARVSYLESAGIPFVTHGRTLAEKPHAYIDGDGAQAFRDATALVVGLGHRRIGHIAGPPELMFTHLRRSGWQSAMAAAGLAADLLEHVRAPGEEDGRQAALRLLARRPRPTALLCATDIIAIGALSAARGLGLKPGRDVTIIGHDGLSIAAFSDPPLTTMQIAAPDIGVRLARLLVQRIAGVAPADLQVVMPVRLVSGGTHGPPAPGHE